MDSLNCEVYFVGVSIRFAFVNFKSEICVYMFSECCRHKQNELEVKRGTEIHNTTVKMEINRQIEMYISNSRPHLKRKQLNAV